MGRVEESAPTKKQLAHVQALIHAMTDEELQGLWLCVHGYGLHECPDDRGTIISHLMGAVGKLNLADDMTARDLARLLAG